jgi:putative transposase
MFRFRRQGCRAHPRLHVPGAFYHVTLRGNHPVLVDADEYLLELLRYIHLNPVRARMVSHPRDYAWSSHHAYAGTVEHPWVTTDFALAMFHRDRLSAIAAYQRFIDQDVSRLERNLRTDGPAPESRHQLLIRG